VTTRLHDWILKRAGDETALEGAGAIYSLAELSREAALLANKLREAGAIRSEPIVLQINNEPSDVIGFLGIWMKAGVTVRLHVGAAATTREMVASRTGARFSVAASSVLTIAERAPPDRPLLKDAAVIVFTSGSTGVPKGVVVGHKGLIAKLEMLSD